MTRFHRKINMTLDWMYNNFFINHKYMNNIFKIMNNHLHVFPWLSNFYLSITNVFGFCFVQHGITWISSLKISILCIIRTTVIVTWTLIYKIKQFFFVWKLFTWVLKSMKLYRWDGVNFYCMNGSEDNTCKHWFINYFSQTKWQHKKWWQFICPKKFFFNISIMHVNWKFSIFFFLMHGLLVLIIIIIIFISKINNI